MPLFPHRDDALRCARCGTVCLPCDAVRCDGAAAAAKGPVGAAAGLSDQNIKDLVIAALIIILVNHIGSHYK